MFAYTCKIKFSGATWRVTWLATAPNVTCVVALGTFLASVRWWLRLADPLLVSPSEATAATHHHDPPGHTKPLHKLWCWDSMVTAWFFTLSVLTRWKLGHIVCRAGKQVQRCVMNCQVDMFHIPSLGGERRSVMKFSRRARRQNYRGVETLI